MVIDDDWGKWAVREWTSGVAGTKSVGSGGRFTKSEQEVEPLLVSRSANKGEMVGETLARFIIRRNAGIRLVSR